MDLKSINLKDTYWSGEDNLIENFYIPCLNNSVFYDRAVGFFSSSILNYISEGLFNFIMNNGIMRIICSTELSQNDIEKIHEGYDTRAIIEQCLTKQLELLLLDKDKPNVKNLCWLIKNNRLDIRICLRNVTSLCNVSDSTLFHEKFGVFRDASDNAVSFLGSINESISGWMFNEESFEVSYNWESILTKRVSEKIERFEKLWSGTANEVTTYEFPHALKMELINIAPDEPIDTFVYYTLKKSNQGKEFIPRECQLNAYRKFIDSSYICMYQMATGSGKTKAALYSYKKIVGWKILLILVPSTELVLQWESDVKQFFPNTYIIKCSSDYAKWKDKLLDIIQAKIPEQTIAISTYDSAISEFSIDKWMEINADKFGIVCDEAHNLGATQTQKLMELTPRFRIGLSATPSRNFDEEGSEKILKFFNNNTYEFSIKDAIREKYLVEYEYFIYPSILNRREWAKYVCISKEISKIKSYSDSNDEKKMYKEDMLKKKYMERSELLKTAQSKLDLFPTIVKAISRESRTLVYADSVEHLNGYARELDKLSKEYFIYTGNKDSKLVRPKMLEEFRLGIRKMLLAINCLDEGIDIPVCDAAIFISSSTSERQFIQRRGRILRKSIGKSRAYVYDYIVIPDYNPGSEYELDLAKQVILKEYKRISIIAEDAINGNKAKNALDDILNKYGLSIFNY